jgi:hypothetical protein
MKHAYATSRQRCKTIGAVCGLLSTRRGDGSGFFRPRAIGNRLIAKIALDIHLRKRHKGFMTVALFSTQNVKFRPNFVELVTIQKIAITKINIKNRSEERILIIGVKKN